LRIRQLDPPVCQFPELLAGCQSGFHLCRILRADKAAGFLSAMNGMTMRLIQPIPEKPGFFERSQPATPQKPDPDTEMGGKEEETLRSKGNQAPRALSNQAAGSQRRKSHRNRLAPDLETGAV